jgi:predicted RNA-binding protein YlxR (DUF448 family)
LVAAPDGTLLVDWHRKAPGRGTHLCYAQACLEIVATGRGLSRALKRHVDVPDVESLRRAILDSVEGRIKNLLSIGRTAGWALSGTDVLLRAGRRIRLLVLAEDIAAESERKLRAAVTGKEATVLVYGDAVFLGQTQGKEARVALGVIEQKIAQRLLAEFERRNRLSGAS